MLLKFLNKPGAQFELYFPILPSCLDLFLSYSGILITDNIHSGEKIEKEFVLNNQNCKLPPAKAFFEDKVFTIERLQSAKRRLNTTKDKLNEKDISIWGRHTSQTNLTGTVVQVIDWFSHEAQ